jgi:Xaa-Pro aminopeptidase
MQPNSIAIIPAAHEVTRSYDSEFKFRQDSDFWYLTGFPEPDAIAVIDPSSKKPFTLYVRPRDPLMETWYGRRQGVEGAVKNYGADRSFSVERFGADMAKLLDGKDVLYYRFSVDRNQIGRRDTNDAAGGRYCRRGSHFGNEEGQARHERRPGRIVARSLHARSGSERRCL